MNWGTKQIYQELTEKGVTIRRHPHDNNPSVTKYLPYQLSISELPTHFSFVCSGWQLWSAEHKNYWDISQIIFSVHCIHIYKLKHRNIKRICIFTLDLPDIDRFWNGVMFCMNGMNGWSVLKRQCHILSAGASDDICMMWLKVGKRHELRLIGELTFNISSVAIITRINRWCVCRDAQVQRIPWDNSTGQGQTSNEKLSNTSSSSIYNTNLTDITLWLRGLPISWTVVKASTRN